MERIDAYKTADGRVHTSQRDAYRHADELFGAAITKHAHALCQIDKYSATLDYLEQHADELAQLVVLKADRDNIEGQDES